MVVDEKEIQVMSKATSQAATNNYEAIAQDPLKHVITLMEKKVRNMDKRKVKLDGYRNAVAQGGTLDRDQQAAVNKYSEVVGSLDFAKDLIKSLSGLATEVSKAQQKVQIQEQAAKKEKNLKRSQFVAKAQILFKLLFTQDRIKQDFLQGSNNAVQLEEKEWDLLLKFYETCMIYAQDTGDNVLENSAKLGKCLNSLYDGTSEKISGGTTYSEIKVIFTKICECEYFENVPDFSHVEDAEAEAEHGEEEASSASSLEDDGDHEFEDGEEAAKSGIEFSSQSASDQVSASSDAEATQQEPVDQSAPYTSQEYSGSFSQLADNEVTENKQSFEDAPPTSENASEPQSQQQEHIAFMSFQYEDVSSSQPVAPQGENQSSTRPAHTIEELLSEVQGEYNFLQESMLDHDVAAVRSGMPYSGQAIHSNMPVDAMSSQAAENLQPTPFVSKSGDSSEKDTNYLDNGPSLSPSDVVSQLHHSNTPSNSLYYVEPEKSESYSNAKLNQGPESQGKPAADNLGMGQTTFGSGEQSYNIDIPAPSSQYSGSLRSMETYQSQQVDLNLRKGVSENSYSTSPFSSLHGNSQPPFEGSLAANSIPDPIPLPSNNPIVPQSLATPDPPTTRIPFPNEKMSGYQSYTASSQSVSAGNLSQGQEDAANQFGNMPENQVQSSLLSAGDAEHMATTAMKPEPTASDDMQNESAMPAEPKEDLGANGRVTGNKTAPTQAPNTSMNRNNRSGGYSNTGQQSNNNYNRGNVMQRQHNQGLSGGFYNQNRGGNYRPGHNRNYGNFDSMGHPKHFNGPGGGFQHPQGAGMSPFNSQYNRQDNNMYGGMQRRGGSGPARGNRGYAARVNMRVGGSSNNYNRSRNYRPPNSEQAA